MWKRKRGLGVGVVHPFIVNIEFGGSWVGEWQGSVSSFSFDAYTYIIFSFCWAAYSIYQQVLLLKTKNTGDTVYISCSLSLSLIISLSLSLIISLSLTHTHTQNQHFNNTHEHLCDWVWSYRVGGCSGLRECAQPFPVCFGERRERTVFTEMLSLHFSFELFISSLTQKDRKNTTDWTTSTDRETERTETGRALAVLKWEYSHKKHLMKTWRQLIVGVCFIWYDIIQFHCQVHLHSEWLF